MSPVKCHGVLIFTLLILNLDFRKKKIHEKIGLYNLKYQ